MIRIGKLTDYGIVLLTHFARDQRPILTARDLAEESKLPLPTVGKILKALSRADLLVSHRGVKGGYQLTQSPEKISIAEIITVLEGPIAMTECSTTPSGLCDFETVCPAKNNWQKISGAVLKALEGLSLADMSGHLTHKQLQTVKITSKQRSVDHEDLNS